MMFKVGVWYAMSAARINGSFLPQYVMHILGPCFDHLSDYETTWSLFSAIWCTAHIIKSLCIV